jgi:hypothetical protein
MRALLQCETPPDGTDFEEYVCSDDCRVASTIYMGTLARSLPYEILEDDRTTLLNLASAQELRACTIIPDPLQCETPPAGTDFDVYVCSNTYDL